MASSSLTLRVTVSSSCSAVAPSPAGAAVGAVARQHVGFVSMPLSSLEGSSRLSSSRRFSQSASFLCSSQCFSQCKLLYPGACSPSGRQPRQQSAVCMVLPTANPVKEGQGTGPRGHPAWSARAIKSFSMAELEARKLKYPTTGTEAVLMGILTEGTSHASRFLRRNGVTLFAVRDETIKILGKADMYFFSPEHPPITEQAQKALDWAIEERTKKGADEEITTSYLLLGIWAQKGSAGQKVLETLGFDGKKAEELLATDKQPVAVS